MEALLAEWRRCPPVRITFAGFVEYKPPADGRQQAPVMTQDQLLMMFGGVQGVKIRSAKNDPMIRMAFPERFAAKTGTDG